MLLFSCVLMGLWACTPQPVRPLKLGLNAWVGYDPLVLARDQGLLDAQLVKVVELSSSTETLRHFRNGLLDAAALTLDEALRLADEGQDVKVVVVMSTSSGADVVLADPAIRRLEQLQGMAIAVEGSTVGAVMLQRLLAAAKLSPAQVTVINLEASQHLAALRDGRVSAAVSYEPLAGALRTAGYRPIFDSSQILGDIADVLVVRGAALRERPHQVRALVAGWQRGMRAFQLEPQAAAQVLAPGVDLDPQAYIQTLNGLRFLDPAQSLALLEGAPPQLGQDAQGLSLTLQALGLIRETPDWGDLLAPGPAQDLAQAQGMLP